MMRNTASGARRASRSFAVWFVVINLVIGYQLSISEARAASPVASPQVELIPAFDADLPMGFGEFSEPPSTYSVAATSTALCTVYASDPWANGTKTRVLGEGSQFCSGNFLWQSITVEIQQYRSLGYWATKASGSVNKSTLIQIYKTVSWTCGSGSGNQLYRIVTYGSFKDLNLTVFSAAVQSLNYLRVTCPP